MATRREAAASRTGVGVALSCRDLSEAADLLWRRRRQHSLVPLQRGRPAALTGGGGGSHSEPLFRSIWLEELRGRIKKQNGRQLSNFTAHTAGLIGSYGSLERNWARSNLVWGGVGRRSGARGDDLEFLLVRGVDGRIAQERRAACRPRARKLHSTTRGWSCAPALGSSAN